jgi:hypothetical protein
MAGRKTRTRRPPELTAKELRKIPIDPELSRPGTEVRILPDGRLVYKLTFGRTPRVWPSREAFVQWRKETDAEVARGPIDFSLTHLPPIDEFLRDVQAHAAALGPRLGIPDATLDGTVASLEAVDKALRRIPRPERLVADLVTPLTAYVGEVYRRASGGHWMKPPPTYTRWGVEHPTKAPNEPFISAGNGQSFQPFGDVLIPIFEPSKRGPLHPTVAAQLAVSGYPEAP